MSQGRKPRKKAKEESQGRKPRKRDSCVDEFE
jgi:hypothetical protein